MMWHILPLRHVWDSPETVLAYDIELSNRPMTFCAERKKNEKKNKTAVLYNVH